MFKSINNLIENRYFTNRNNSAYFLRNSELLQIPTVRSCQSQNYIAFHGAKVWNSLPGEIRSKSSLSSFKFSLKNYLLNNYGNEDTS